MHRGVDLAGSEGTDIFAALDGTVAAAGPASGFGQWIVVDSQTSGGLVSTVYGHMYPDGVLVRQGTSVKAGDHIAELGNNGQSTGPHLHFEYWEGGRLSHGQAVDPSFLLNASAPSADSLAVQQVSGGGGLPDRGTQAGSGSQGVCAVAAQGGCVVSGHHRAAAGRATGGGERVPAGATAPVSSTGAQGPAQFMPGTWKTWGKDADSSGPPPMSTAFRMR